MAQPTSRIEQLIQKNNATFEAWQEKRRAENEKIWLLWKALPKGERERAYAAEDRRQREFHERYSFWPGKTTSQF